VTTDDSRWQQVNALLEQALAKPDDERETWLDEACGDDQSLKREVIELLGYDGAQTGGLKSALESAAGSLVGDDNDRLIGEVLGAYRITGKIADGGMGAVYVAERADDEFEQRVAIKMVRFAMASAALIERFQLERQILAGLEHPNIARLLDGGRTASGIPYLVMEYVDGKSIIDYVTESTPAVNARLELFLVICDAVQYAHRKLVVHRDIKPSNILVTADGEPKLLDFGIAKFLAADAEPGLTQADVRVMTPEYASPEQILGAPVTTATDVYGLGLVLYQLLAGKMPFDLSSKTSPEIREIICHTEPQAPSIAATSIGRHDLASHVSGDLDRIVLKALRKEPERRYGTANELAADLRNFLEDRPVSARGDSAAYRTRKFLTRHRSAAIASLAVVIAISVQTVVYTNRLAAERDVARLQADRAEEVAGFMTDLFAEANPSRNLGQPLTARQMLDRGATRIVDELTSQPELQAALMVTIAESYEHMEENVAARDYLAEAVPAIEQRLGKEHPDVRLLRYLQGSVMTFVGDTDMARPIHEENLAIARRLNGETSIEAAREIRALAVIDSRTGNYEQAEAGFAEAIATYRSLGETSQDELAKTLLDYGAMLRRLDRGDEEEPMLLEALAIQDARVGKRHPAYAAVVNNLGNHYFRRGDLETARGYMEKNVELQRELNGEASVPYGVALVNYASLLKSEGDSEKALELYLDALDIYEKGYGADAPRYAYLLENVANTMVDLGRYDEAEAAYGNALAILGQHFGTGHPEYAFTQRNLGISLGRMGRPEAAVPELRAAIAIWVDANGPLYSRVITTRTSLAKNLIDIGELEAARAEALKAAEAARESMPEDSAQRLEAVRVAARAHSELGEFDAASVLYEESLAIASRLGDQAARETVTTEIDYARSLDAQGRTADARQQLESRLSTLTPDSDPDGKLTAEIAETLDRL